MKKVMMGLILLFIVAASYAQSSITVRSEQGEDVDYTKYKTFGWASQVSNELEAGVYFLNDLVLKAQVRDAVKSELLGLGYEMNADQPDLLVNFRVFDQPVTIKGAEDYGDNYWGNDNYSGISNESYDVEAGTLLVSLADRESGRVVWQGFASGLIDNNQFIKDEGKIHEAVDMIFAEYNERATEYSKK
jgi:hypothetical protein